MEILCSSAIRAEAAFADTQCKSPQLSALPRATWGVREGVHSNRHRLCSGASADRGREPGCGGYPQVVAPRLCDPAGELASSNIHFLTARVGGIP
jgi:hypothetical protein